MIAVLVDAGFEVELNWTGFYADGPAFTALILTELNTAAFEDWVVSIIAAETNYAEVVQAGLE